MHVVPKTGPKQASIDLIEFVRWCNDSIAYIQSHCPVCLTFSTTTHRAFDCEGTSGSEGYHHYERRAMARSDEEGRKHSSKKSHKKEKKRKVRVCACPQAC